MHQTLGEASAPYGGLPGAFSIGQSRYINGTPFKPPFPLVDPPTFITVFHIDQHSVSEQWLENTVDRLRADDDVFRDEFLEGVVFVLASEVKEAHVRGLTRGLGTRFELVYTGPNALDVRPGPHRVLGDTIAPIYRLHDDTHGAFLHSLLAAEMELSSSYRELMVQGSLIQTTAVAVPSRMAYSPTKQHPLSGIRVAVKDIFQIKDVRTSVCNKAYYELYPPPTKTAACIEILSRAGAVILGTTKLASFAATEEPVECIDYQAPWNPRADGYQSPAGSSSGSGVAVAAYSWVDIAIGSDTSGSGRRPGHWNGCFAMRPTHGVLPTDGYIPSFERFDTPTFFGRDLLKCREFAKEWYGNLINETTVSGRTAIVYPTDYMSLIGNQVQLGIIADFVRQLESSLGTEHEKISFEAVWESNPPPEAGDLTLKEFMQDVGRNSFFYDDYHSFDKFRSDYFAKFGKQPYVSPPVRWQWELSSKITKEERDIAVAKLNVYRHWFTENVMKETTQDTIIVLPIEEISPRYRDEAPTSHFNPVGVPNLFLSPILGCPELTVPIGHFPYHSRVSDRIEQLPIAVSILGPQGHDLRLFDIAYDSLTKAKRYTEVRPGRDMF